MHIYVQVKLSITRVQSMLVANVRWESGVRALGTTTSGRPVL